MDAKAAENGLANTVARIDLGRLRANANVFTAASPPGMELMAVVKGDAYGHGAVSCTRALAHAGVRFFAVANLAEARQLRRAGIRDRVLVFAPPLPEQINAYGDLNVDINLATLESVRLVAENYPSWIPRTHVKLDTGMSRLGLQPESIREATSLIEATGKRPAAVWTHLSHSSDALDGHTRAQYDLFRTLIASHGLGDLATHVLNTGGFVHHPEYRSVDVSTSEDAWCRIGIGLYGIQSTTAAPADRLRPVMQLVSRVLQVRQIGPDTGVSYGHTWRSARNTRIATVGAGYADGVPRLLSSRGSVGLANQDDRFPIIGRVCMDMFMIDVGPEDGTHSIRPGDEVIVFGDGGPSANEVAAWAETISYEVCCGIAPRVPRSYVNG